MCVCTCKNLLVIVYADGRGGQMVGCGRSVVDDDGASHPQAGMRVWRGQHQPLRWALGGPAEGDLLTGLPTGTSQLGPGQQPSGPPEGQNTTGQDQEVHVRSHAGFGWLTL